MWTVCNGFSVLAVVWHSYSVDHVIFSCPFTSTSSSLGGEEYVNINYCTQPSIVTNRKEKKARTHPPWGCSTTAHNLATSLSTPADTLLWSQENLLGSSLGWELSGASLQDSYPSPVLTQDSALHCSSPPHQTAAV